MMFFDIFDNSQLARSDEMYQKSDRADGCKNNHKKTVTDNLGDPYENCIDNTQVLSTAKEKGSDYHQNSCNRICMLRHLESACNCSLPYHFGLPDSWDTCDLAFILPIKENFDYQSNCESSCPLECDSVSLNFKSKETKNQ